MIVHDGIVYQDQNDLRINDSSIKNDAGLMIAEVHISAIGQSEDVLFFLMSS